MSMEILVETKNEVLGDAVFWRGPAERIDEIRNIAARQTARLVAKDGKKRVCGMWHVSAITAATAPEQAPKGLADDKPHWDEPDPLYADAIAMARRGNGITVCEVQTHFRIGYSRAARMVEQMEAEDIVAPAEPGGHHALKAIAQ